MIDLLYSYHNPKAELPEALDTLKRAIQEVQKRLIIGLPNWKVKIVDKDGVRDVELAL
jgi:20S proteasome subunit beta 4